MKSLPEISTDIDAAPHYVSNTGSGFQLFETTPTESMIANGTFIDTIEGSSKGESWVGGQKFLFYQMHWHTPSENTIDGRSFPLEAHFVHQLDDPMLVGTLHRLAVISLLYEPGPCNAFLDQFWEEFPMVPGFRQHFADGVNDFERLADEVINIDEGEGYFYWHGSLTTPPCTEGVGWYMLKHRETVCDRQIDALRYALAVSQDGNDFNNRVVQPLNHRIVVQTPPRGWRNSSDSGGGGDPPPPATVATALGGPLQQAQTSWWSAPASEQPTTRPEHDFAIHVRVGSSAQQSLVEAVAGFTAALLLIGLAAALRCADPCRGARRRHGSGAGASLKLNRGGAGSDSMSHLEQEGGGAAAGGSQIPRERSRSVGLAHHLLSLLLGGPLLLLRRSTRRTGGGGGGESEKSGGEAGGAPAQHEEAGSEMARPSSPYLDCNDVEWGARDGSQGDR